MKVKLILLVEDNPDDEALTIRSLKKHKILNKVVVKRDGAEALDYLLTDSNIMPAVVLLDLKLPKVDGLQVLRSLRSDNRTKLLPVVVLTSSDQEQDIIESYSLGCNSYVRKPVDFAKFSESIRSLGLYWLLVNEPPPDTGEHQ